MIATKNAVIEGIRPEHLRELVHSPGPCITIFLPASRPREPEGSAALLLRAKVDSAAKELSHRRFPESEAASLLQPLNDPAFGAPSNRNRVILCSRDVTEQFHLTQPVEASLTVASCFSIRQLLPEISIPRSFHVLALSKTHVTLFRCAGFDIEEVALPAAIANLADSLALKPPDHDLENRSASGSSVGAMAGVRFGTGSGREQDKGHRADFYKLVDRAIKTREPDGPLILAGVDEDTAAYRRANTNPNLVPRTIRGSASAQTDKAKILNQAYVILHGTQRETQAAALLEAHERHVPGGFSDEFDTILPMAFEGRVSRLYLNEKIRKVGLFDKGRYRSFGTEDLLNLAAVETLLHGGDAFELPADMIPGKAPAIAIMRY